MGSVALVRIRRRGRAAGLGALVIVLVACGAGRSPAAARPTTSPPVTPSTTPTLAPGCRADVNAGVHDPWRLQLVRRCVTVTGTVRAVYTTGDGDLHVDLEVDPRYRGVPNTENVRQNHGWLVTETVPADLPRVHRPARGDHVAVTGALVIDLAHGWVEVHPVWRIALVAG